MPRREALRSAWALLALVAFLLTEAARAHNPDTSYVRCRIAADSLEVRFTFDVFTLLKITSLDRDEDRKLTQAELENAAPEITRFLRDHVVLEIDGKPASMGEADVPVWPRDASPEIPAADWHSAAALIAIPFRQPLSVPIKDVALSFSIFEQFSTRHTVLGAFEFAGHSEEVTFTLSEPDYLFDATYLTSQETVGSHTSPNTGGAAKETVWPALMRFLKLGVEHIFNGYDHVCFLLALVVVSRLGELVKIVTAFTLAHSITLIAAVLQWVYLPSRLIECAIALTIVYVAVENLMRKQIARRWVLAFFFGLIHGFGFANVLSELGLPANAMIRCLLSFNVGVELGQLAIVCLALPLILWLARMRAGPRWIAALNVLIALFGIGWFVERVFRLGFMPI